MATTDPKPLTRDQLASFLGNNELIRRFERLFQVSGELTPAQIEALLAQVQQLFALVEEASIDSGTADAKAAAAGDAVAALERLCDVLAVAPASAADNPLALAAMRAAAVRPAASSDHLERAVRALELIASRPQAEVPRVLELDYLDFSATPPHVDVPRRINWNSDDDTLNINHSGGVIQQVGQELYGRITNSTGSTIPDGAVVGIDAPADSYLLFVADGTLSPINILGVATQEIPDGEPGRVTVWGYVRDIDTTGTPFGETWVSGDILYVSPTTAGGFTKVKPTAPNLSMPIAQVSEVSATAGRIFVRPTIEQQLYYGSFVKTSDQAPVVVDTAYAITWDSSPIASGVSIGTPSSRIVVDHAGLYKFTASFQLTSSSASVKNVWLWFRKNGVDVPDSAMVSSLDSATAVSAPSRSLFFSLEAGDYIELMFASDSTSMTLDNLAATAFAPAAPAAILTVNQEQQ